MNGKRTLRIMTALGFALCVLGVLLAANGIRRWLIPVRTAEIIQITDTGFIHGPGDDIRDEHTEDVVALTEDGETVTLTVKSMEESSLPAVGDTIRVYGANEYSGWYEKTGIWFGYGGVCVYFGGFILRKVYEK